MTAEDQSLIEDITLTINAFFGWDFNSCEALRQNGVFQPIDFANACPDSQVTSLHYHFPWLIKANLRWAVFCAATRRRVRHNLDWAPYFEVAATDLPYREKLAAWEEATCYTPRERAALGWVDATTRLAEVARVARHAGVVTAAAIAPA